MQYNNAQNQSISERVKISYVECVYIRRIKQLYL